MLLLGNSYESCDGIFLLMVFDCFMLCMFVCFFTFYLHALFGELLGISVHIEASQVKGNTTHLLC